MLIVNKQEYSKSDFELRLQVYEEMEQFKEAKEIICTLSDRLRLCFLKRNHQYYLYMKIHQKKQLLKWQSVQIM